ncbi:hypothetical protein C2S51_001112 [Perilla frutescens var. frutescens]|nr:hypothetical protein C2S51_001112 [Perilla frutescens var. frutescens]
MVVTLTVVEEGVIDLSSSEGNKTSDDGEKTICMNYSAREWGKNLFLFKFGTQEEMEWVIKHQSWHYDNQLFVIAPLQGHEKPSMIQLTQASFWVRAYDLPVSCLNMRTAKALAGLWGILWS